jgi:hypothetical protein
VNSVKVMVGQFALIIISVLTFNNS